VLSMRYDISKADIYRYDQIAIPNRYRDYRENYFRIIDPSLQSTEARVADAGAIVSVIDGLKL